MAPEAILFKLLGLWKQPLWIGLKDRGAQPGTLNRRQKSETTGSSGPGPFNCYSILNTAQSGDIAH